MQGGDDDGVRHAAESLRALRDELPTAAEHVDGTVRKRIEAVTGAVDQAAKGVGSELRGELLSRAHEIRLIGTEMAAAREDAFAAVSHVLSGYADEIEALLRPAASAGSGADGISVDSPPTPPPDLVMASEPAAAVQRQLPTKDAHRRAINQVVAQFPPKLQELAKRLLFGKSAHAVQRHGHHLRREHQVARVQWRLDPAGEDGWQLNADGSVESWRKKGGGQHRVGTASGQYTTPEAVAKPLVALLRAAGRTQADLDRYLAAKADGDTAVTIFLHPSVTGITSEDVFVVQAAGTDTESGDRMWKRARRGAMAGHGEPPATRARDMVANGSRPGSVIFFYQGPDDQWRLVTSYFTDDRGNEMTYTEL